MIPSLWRTWITILFAQTDLNSVSNLDKKIKRFIWQIYIITFSGRQKGCFILQIRLSDLRTSVYHKLNLCFVCMKRLKSNLLKHWNFLTFKSDIIIALKLSKQLSGSATWKVGNLMTDKKNKVFSWNSYGMILWHKSWQIKNKMLTRSKKRACRLVHLLQSRHLQ